ncbi:MAG: oligosaccharide flippase family protein [Gemmataceae bacterium]|nr:oligosaccharide flippase family protein [Gemmataceae bacterium]
MNAPDKGTTDAAPPSAAPDTELVAGAAQASPDEPAAPSADTAAVPNLRRAALSSAMWIGIGFGTLYVLRWVAGVVQTHLVTPEVFGLIGLSSLFLTGLHMFSDVGIGLSIIQSKRGDDPAFLNTAWTLQVVRSLILWGATWVIAWPVAYIYDEPLLMWLIPLSGVTAVIDGFNSTALYTLARQLRRGPLVALEVGVQATGVAVTTAYMIWISPTVWAFVIGSLVTSLINMTLTHLALPGGGGNRFRWEKEAAHDLLHFGKWIFFSTLITFLAFQADRLIMSKVAGLDWFGVFDRAMSLASIATGLMSMFATQLVFPVYSQMHQSGRDIRQQFGRVHTSAAAFAALLVSGMLAAGPAAVLCMYGDRFSAAAWMLPFIAVSAWFQMLEGTTGASLLTLGEARAVTAGNASRLVGVLVFVPIGYWVGQATGLGGSLTPPADGLIEISGFIGMLLGFIAADFGRYLTVGWLARLNGMVAWPIDLTMSVLIVVISLAALFSGEYLAALFDDHIGRPKVRLLLRFLIQGTLVVLFWGLLFLAWRRQGRWRRVAPSEP